MVGTWAENTEDAHVELSCRWTTNQNFLLLSYRVVRDEAVDFQVSQIIGWDPQKQVIRSWQFDSDGGYGVGRWKATSDGWSVQTRQVLQDGRNAAATYFYDRPADDRLRFRSLGREIEGELVEDIEPLELGRVSED
ncbi:MAG: hypothetical protein KDA60_05000 [Planctomycetales bacterium]|nr:hypothetical protein [Planctomycetales bacterium]